MVMGTKRLQFCTKPDINGNTHSLVIDIDNKVFSWNNHWINSDFIRIGYRDLQKMRKQLKWFGYKEV